MEIINKIGEVYNNCIVIQKDEERSIKTGRTHWLLKCNNCGEILSRRSDALMNIKCKCTPRHYSQDNSKRIASMLNKKFGYLTVIEYISDRRAPDGSILYKCICDCGKECEKSGTSLRKGTKSCGCLIGKNKNKKNIEDLSNQKFNKITLLSMTDKRDSSKSIIYNAKCDCGKIFEVTGSRVKNGYTKSCGCALKERYVNEQIKQQYSDLYTKNEMGNKYGLLTVIGRNGSTLNNKAIWHCKCECGNEIDVTGDKLRKGQISCGCLKDSKDVYYIKQLLKDNNIFFINEYIFDKCKDKKVLPFDFYINNLYIIEYDGSQHFHPTSNSTIYTPEKYKITHNHDLIKNKYCFDNNIPLIRIPYDVEYTIDDLKLETTRFLLTPENEQEYYNSRA